MRCHADHAVAKFWGVCNEQKWALDACLREEKAINRCALVASVFTVFLTTRLFYRKGKSHSCAPAPLLAHVRSPARCLLRRAAHGTLHKAKREQESLRAKLAAARAPGAGAPAAQEAR